MLTAAHIVDMSLSLPTAKLPAQIDLIQALSSLSFTTSTVLLDVCHELCFRITGSFFQYSAFHLIVQPSLVHVEESVKDFQMYIMCRLTRITDSHSSTTNVNGTSPDCEH
jgi:hypothetical protein